MARTLQVNVQIDRLPDIPVDTKQYFGVRLSAWINPDGTAPALVDDRHMLAPWEWSAPNAALPGGWTPGASSSWKAWWVDPTHTPPTVTPAQIMPFVNSDAAGPAPSEWTTPRDKLLLDLAQDHRRMEAPAKSPDGRPAPIADHTVFGFVESLSAFPAPWPELHKVWTCLRVDTAAPNPSCELVVVPLFGVTGPSAASYATAADPAISGTVPDHVWRVTYAPVAAPGIGASAVVDRLAEAQSVGLRILLKKSFLIGGAKSWAEPSGQDWAIQLPTQIAEILDPAKGLTQGLEQALAKQTNLPALPSSHNERTALRLLLGSVYWRVLSPTATGTHAITPLPMAFARANPSPALQNFLAGLSVRDAARDPANLDATIPGFVTLEQVQVWTDARLVSLLGQPKDNSVDAEDHPGVETPEGLRAFLLQHWLNAQATPATLSVTPTPLLRFNAAKWSGGHVVADPDGGFGLFDLGVLAKSEQTSVGFTLNVGQANVAIVAKLVLDGNPTPIASLQTDPIAATGSHTLTLTVVSPAPAPGAAAPAPSFQMSIGGGGAPKSVNLSETKTSIANRRASITLQLAAAATKVTVAPQAVPQDIADKLLGSMPEPALRANASIVHAAPFIPSILAGTKHDGTDVTGASSPTDKITAALADWSDYRLKTECDEAIRIVEALAPISQAPKIVGAVAIPQPPVTLADIKKVEPLLQFARDVAITNAKDRAARLFAALGSDAADYALSPKATPIVFPIDQPMPIANNQDIWSAFSGAGVLTGVSGSQGPWPDQNYWYSLNLASMYAPTVDPATNIRQPLSTSKVVKGPSGPFDPVPLQVGEISGVRAANLTYENRSLVGEMPHDPTHVSSRAARAVPRRIEAYGFPLKGGGIDPRLPALCFGKRYFFLPYLIGHGGSLPVFLRDGTNLAVATKLRPRSPLPSDGGNSIPVLQFSSNDLKNGTAEPIDPDDLVRHSDYRRTTPVGTPRISAETDLPGVPQGVEALASELPLQAAAITIAAGEMAFFYRNQERSEGVLDFTAADPARRVLQIDFAGLPKGDTAPKRPALQVDLKARAGKHLSIAIAESDWPADISLGLRVIAGKYGIEIFAQKPLADIFVERPPQFAFSRTVAPTPADFTGWQGFSVQLSNASATDATLVPPIVSLGTSQASDHQLDDPRQIDLPELAQQKRVISLLDGIPPASSVPDHVTIRVRRPAVEFSTFERWINWDLSDKDIKKALDAAHKMLVLDPVANKSDLTIDDPAVERVVVELVELFPKPHLHDRAPLATDWSAKAALINGFGPGRPADSRLPVRVARLDSHGTPAENVGLIKAGGLADEIVLAPGGVYEIRFYAAIREGAQNFATGLPPSSMRFGKGTWQGLRKASIGGKPYRLGVPLVRTFEVATDAMPVLYDQKRSEIPMTIDRLTALSGSADRAQIGLSQEFVSANYPAIRYVNQLSLLNQRWGWRGRPIGTLPRAADFAQSPIKPNRPVPGFGQTIRDQGRRLDSSGSKDFETIAFIDRRDGDIGVIDETKLHLANVLPPTKPDGSIVAVADDNRPPVFTKDLQYRGGANWWRFALMATSRYAAMKPNLGLVRYSHIDLSARLNAYWHTLIVRDRDTGRRPKRPGLLLVLPLTETVMSDVAVPPLLAIFSEPMFPGFHVGDGVEAALDYVRHPLPDAPILWTTPAAENQARTLTAKIASTYTDFAKDTTKQDRRTALRVAVATFNQFARAQAATLAAANLAEAEKNQTDLKAALDQVSHQPMSPAQQAALVKAQEAYDYAVARSKDARDTVGKANTASATADQLLQSVKQGGNGEVPYLQVEMQRFWPQIGPDPILTSDAHAGNPVAMRLDGPIGYTFDLETEAANFGRSGYLVSPVPGSDGGTAKVGKDAGIAALANIAIRPWTLARLRFRRIEATELSLYESVPVSKNGTASNLLLSSEGVDLTRAAGTTATAAAVTPPAAAPPPPGPPAVTHLGPAVAPAIQPVFAKPPPVVAPAEYHEGLVIDFDELDENGANATISVKPPIPDITPWSDRYVRVSTTVTPGILSIFFNTDLGPAGSFDVALRPTSRIWLRLVLSQREKPQQSEKPYEPALDVSVRLLIDDGDGDGLARSQAGAWITVACLPLLAGGKVFKPSDPIYVNVTQTDPSAAAQATGARLTPFTAPVWCQFTQDVSRFTVKTTKQSDKQDCLVSNLVATLDSNNTPQLALALDDGTSEPLQSIEWLGLETTSQIRCTVAVILTEFISDVFDRVRERPLAVYRIVDGTAGPATMTSIWQTPEGGNQAKLTRARVRLMTLMHLQLDWRQPPSPPASLEDYFAEPLTGDIGMDPGDSTGRILGVSKPVKVSFAK